MKYLKIFEDFNKKPKWSECADCSKFPEDYWFEGWSKYIPKSKQNKYICVSCLEKRVGRELKKSDFKPWNHYYKGQEWYEKLKESYNSFTELENEIEDIKLILQDFKDDSWVVNIDYAPKRWENPKANFTIESDNIKIYLKKKNCKSGSKYPLDAEFSSIEIKDEINQILSIHSDNKFEFRICTADRSYKDENHKHFVEIRNYLYGKWESMSTEDFIDFISGDNKLLGIDIKIYLNTENLDLIKKFESFEEYDVDEDSEHLKDLSLDLQDEGEWSITIHTNTEKYNEDEYSCKVILEPLDEFDWDGPGVAEGNDKGGKINETLIQYLENIVKYMEDYYYKIIITSSDDHHEIHLENVEAFKKWIETELKHQTSDIMTFGFKGDFIIIEFYEKDDEINESNIPYKYDWCQPDSPIRKEIEEYIKDLVINTVDDEVRWLYKYHIHWIQNDPYVWIAGSLKENGIHRYKPNLAEINPLLDEITSYLRSEGFETRLHYLPNKENCKQFYIYFKEKSSS